MVRKLKVLFLIALAAAIGAHAQIPRTMSYQGVLVDNAGAPVMDGTYSTTFRLYDVASGGAPLWQETRNIVTVDGRFDIRLGEVQPLNLPFDDPYFLGIQVESDAEMSPRVALASSPYALNAPQGNPPGVASAQPGGASLGPTYTSVLSRSITVPGTGYVLVIGTCESTMTGISYCTMVGADFGVSTSATSAPLNQNVSIAINAGAATLPVTVHGLFAVPSSGTYTYYLVGRNTSCGAASAGSAQLTLLYVPTAMGTVTPTGPETGQ